jgi:hypothetical protein
MSGIPGNISIIGSPSVTSFITNVTGLEETGCDEEQNTTSNQVGGSLVNTSSSQVGSLTTQIANMNLEDKEGGDGGESDVEGELAPVTEVNSSFFEELEVDVEESVGLEDDRGDTKAFCNVTSTGTTEVIGEMREGRLVNSDVNYNITLPKPPPDFVPPTPQADEPLFTNVDNPGEWDEYIFTAKKNKSNKYVCHSLPTGATPVPMNENGKRECGGWEFFYDGSFKNKTNTAFRRNATTSNLFPKEMRGEFDRDMLTRFGLTEKRMKNTDALFFFQLLLPICDPSKSGITNDRRAPYYTELSKFTNLYAYQSGCGADYGHKWHMTSAAELLHFDGVLVHD